MGEIRISGGGAGVYAKKNAVWENWLFFWQCRKRQINNFGFIAFFSNEINKKL